MSVEVIRGRLSNYKRISGQQNFVMLERDKSLMGATAVAASLAGLAGPAIGLAQSASDLEEEAHFLDFELDGLPVRGWVWRAPPMKNGEKVEVVGIRHPEYFHLAAIVLPRDRLIALYPHSSKGGKAYWKNAWKWWAIATGSSTAFTAILIELVSLISDGESLLFGEGWPVVPILVFGMGFMFALIMWFVARRLTFAVQVAEGVFTALGWDNPNEIDLEKTTKATRLPEDPPELGIMYFRY